MSEHGSNSVKRGNFWEVTFKESWRKPEDWTLKKGALEKHTGITKCKVSTIEEAPLVGINLRDKNFQTCDFSPVSVRDSSFNKTHFSECRFEKATFTNVKFSKCEFSACHFLNVEFKRCRFIDCSFKDISISAEQTHFTETIISAGTFIGALKTNTNDLPPNTTASYQNFRFLITKTKIARAIFLSVRGEPELDLVFDAHRTFEYALHAERIAKDQYQREKGQLVSRSWLHRNIMCTLRRASFALVRSAGFLTNWGQNPLKSLWLLIGAVFTFFLLYALYFNINSHAAFLRALDCSFLFGYSRHIDSGDNVLGYATFLNGLVGFFWYAVIIPALSKRLFR